MLIPLLVGAQTKVEIDGIWYNLITKGKVAEVIPSYGEKYSGDLIIPSKVSFENIVYNVEGVGVDAFNGADITSITIPESVTSIQHYAFINCNSLTAVHINSIYAWCNIEFMNYESNPLNYAKNLYLNKELVTELSIPDSVTTIKNYVFLNCSSLASATIPEGVTSIGESAFSCCSNLTSITIPESVTCIGSRAFSGCSSITSIHIPESARRIGENTFSGCSSLATINIPEGVTSIGEYTFYRCSSLASINIPESVTSIGGSAFSDCSSLTAITIPEGVASIGGSAFSHCSSLTTINIPEGVTNIGNYTFYGCSSLTTITIPEGVTNIGEGTFYDCSSLTSINIPEGVASIGYMAFYNCNNLTTITIPKSVGNIETWAFSGCSNLLNVYCYNETPPSTESYIFDGSYPEYATLHVPVESLNAYKTSAPWSSFGNIVALGATITGITLDKTSATLTEEDELTLTITTTPQNADMNLISWNSSNPSVATVDNTGKIIAIASGTATIIAMANDGSGVSASCEVIVNELILGKCATPTISYENGEVVFTCTTEDATIKSEINENASGKFENMRIALLPTYTITAYATKEKYKDSDVATFTICWIPCNEEHESEEDGILTIPSKPALISTRDGVLTLSGLAEDTTVTLYTTDGAMVAQQQSSAGEARFTVDTNQVYLVHIGDKVVKIAM